jgi:hypothetical protein
MKQIGIILSFFLLASLTTKAQPKLKIYGGKNHDQFLGCMTCTANDSSSIWSVFSDYGSTHNAKSIWNETGKYGNKTSEYSPYNKKAKYPPLVLDENGKSYGYLTINKKNPKRSWYSFVNMVSDDRDEIVKDIPKYSERLFKH